jgi:hypothetical protein
VAILYVIVAVAVGKPATLLPSFGRANRMSPMLSLALLRVRHRQQKRAFSGCFHVVGDGPTQSGRAG